MVSTSAFDSGTLGSRLGWILAFHPCHTVAMYEWNLMFLLVIKFTFICFLFPCLFL